MDRVDQHLKMNRRAWDEAHRHLARKRRAEPEYSRVFLDGGGTFTKTEHQLIGNITGLDVLQLSCAGDAGQAFSLANMGAKVTACDFSPVAIEEARSNSRALGIEVEFVVDDSQRLVEFEGAQFDLVHADFNLWYYEDLLTACSNWCRVLRPGDRLLLHEMNPVTKCLEGDPDGDCLRVVWNYDDRRPEYYEFGIQDFESEHQAVEFHHTLSDIVTAVAESGFSIRKMVERVGEDYHHERNAAMTHQSEDSDVGKDRLPQDFFIVADKP